MVQWNFLMHLVNQTAENNGLNFTTSDQAISVGFARIWKQCLEQSEYIARESGAMYF